MKKVKQSKKNKKKISSNLYVYEIMNYKQMKEPINNNDFFVMLL